MVIPVNEKRLLFKWYLAFSYMLAPYDAEMQKNIFHFRMLKYAFGNPDRTNKHFGKASNCELAARYRKILIARNSINDEILSRKTYARRTGEIIRFLNAMTLIEANDPSLNKAFYLLKEGFKGRENSKKGKQQSFSTRTYDKCMKNYNPVLHLCAAYSYTNPDNSRHEGTQSERIRNFFSKSVCYHNFIEQYEYSRQGRNKRDIHYLVSNGLYTFQHDFLCENTSVADETAEFLERVKSYLKGFTHDWEKPVRNT
ncbi:MAG: hypothetical protein KUA35_11920 [Pseudodesulfovibrio sp.]|uniref:Uncharacterized protein n=1 Tax=Pseudodesulfovibrio aespoeensis (strain ATCC 700646 / DSM 10631 / Aspo-2) TaxID=643562 RepID=E6VRS1_PSEA9|nr:MULTISPECIES: hypothetical protein [Pseudodesulfovibrio]ADU64208.1 hypothetical protein Daes_3217 [Pseudodesulfovibrio aespoeensis Aspo-2]MBV1765606.1 hypothetical protein [Pseudodesulfovibrio sp.]MBV1773120.1 hypothetical protein [Pseudodesulfovibrio sp.]MCG2731450.1 hypothetical protein [Pseudodesulfovibrio aespoeensis]